MSPTDALATMAALSATVMTPPPYGEPFVRSRAPIGTGAPGPTPKKRRTKAVRPVRRKSSTIGKKKSRRT